MLSKEDVQDDPLDYRKNIGNVVSYYDCSCIYKFSQRNNTAWPLAICMHKMYKDSDIRTNKLGKQIPKIQKKVNVKINSATEQSIFVVVFDFFLNNTTIWFPNLLPFSIFHSHNLKSHLPEQ